jgi:hypothetical protein
MTFEGLLDLGWTPPADDVHDSTFAPKSEDAREIEGSYEDRGREARGGRRTYR